MRVRTTVEKEKKPKAIGRPTREFTLSERDEVTRMSQIGLPQRQIAWVMKVSAKTLRKHLQRELRTGMADANKIVMETLFKIASDGNTAAVIFWAKTRCGYRQTLGHVDLEAIVDFEDEETQGETEERVVEKGPAPMIVVRENGGEPREDC